MDAKAYFQGKKITLMGLGLLGRGVGDARFLAQCGANLIVTDLKNEEQLAASLEQLRHFPNITFHLGAHLLEDFRDRDLVIKAAGVPLNSPWVAEAEKNNIPVRMSADLFAELSGVPIIGITGTRGKSTTTHMIAHILRAAGKQVLLGGNVRGVSTLELLNHVTENSVAVLELDSWQLQGFAAWGHAPHIAVFTTFFPDHMNYYDNSMERYFADKANIFLNQQQSDTFVLGEEVAPFLKQFGYQQKVRAHIEIVGSKQLPATVSLKIPGEHNRYNAALAAAAARAFGVDAETIAQALTTFEGIEGRLQLLKTKDGVTIYNDNNSTTPDATLAALRALDTGAHNIVLIMGGSEKNLDMHPLIEVIQKTCKRVLFLPGAGTDRIFSNVPKELTGGLIYQSMHEAVSAAYAAAYPGDIILFSPAFASFGLFKNEYDRNDQFVSAIKNV